MPVTRILWTSLAQVIISSSSQGIPQARWKISLLLLGHAENMTRLQLVSHSLRGGVMALLQCPGDKNMQRSEWPFNLNPSSSQSIGTPTALLQLPKWTALIFTLHLFLTHRKILRYLVFSIHDTDPRNIRNLKTKENENILKLDSLFNTRTSKG